MNSYLNYALTLTVLSKHKLNFGFTHNLKSKKLFKDLQEDEQDEYMGWLLDSSMRMSKNRDEGTIEDLITYRFEDHPNIKMMLGGTKRHSHGVLYNMTRDDIATFKHYLVKYLKLNHSTKLQDVCIKIVPIYFENGWITYMNKDNIILDLENDLKELEN